MKGLANQEYLIGFIAFNILALVFIFCSIKWARVGRVLFFLLFAWACWMNWDYSQNNPAAYQEYAELTFLGVYKKFITGWFSHHTAWVVGMIATCQGLIAVSMLLKGFIYKLGCLGGILFLLAISPLGVGSGFPCTVSFAIALFILWSQGKQYWWIRSKRANSL